RYRARQGKAVHPSEPEIDEGLERYGKGPRLGQDINEDQRDDDDPSEPQYLLVRAHQQRIERRGRKQRNEPADKERERYFRRYFEARRSPRQAKQRAEERQ